MIVKVKYIPNIYTTAGRRAASVEAPDCVNLLSVVNLSGFPVDGMRVITPHGISKNPARDFAKNNDIIIVTPHISDPASITAIFTTIGSWISEHLILTAVIVATTAYSLLASRGRRPSFGTLGHGLDEGSPTYSWDGIATQQSPGVPIPVIFGRHRVGGNIINQYVTTDGQKQYLNVLIGLCEGEINKISGVLINDNPIGNFDGITEYQKLGTSGQAVIPNFNDLHNVIAVSANLTKNNPYVYTTIDSDVEAFEIILNLPSGLYQQNATSGAITSWSVTYTVEYKITTDVSYTSLGSKTISAKSRSAVKRIFRKDGLSAGKYDIRITRTSDDSILEPNKTGDLTLQSVDEIKTDDISYPNVALYGVRALATDQLSGSTPNFTFLIEGLKVSVPKIMDGGIEVDWEDYYWDPDAAEYRLLSDDTSLTWDGSTYVDRWSANPIWCMKRLLEDSRFGLGDEVDSSNVSLAEYLDLSRICEQKVPDGDGGYEKLYRMDVVIDSKNKAPDILSQLAATFDGMMFFSENVVKIVIDQDEDAVDYFGMGKIIDGTFNMSWKSKREQYNKIDVEFTNQDKNYTLETVSVKDDDDTDAGANNKEKSLRIHTTKLSYALRAARRALNISQLINRTFTFEAFISSIAISPGDVVGISHDIPQIGFSGRVLSGSTTSSIEIDQTITIEAGKTYKLLIKFADDTVEERTVNNSPGDASTITVSSTFSSAPSSFDEYAFGEENIYYKKVRVVESTLTKEKNVQLTCVEVNSLVYDYSAPTIPTDKYSLLSTEIQDVTNLSLTEMLILAKDGTLINTIEVWFRRPDDTSFYLNKFSHAKIFISDDAGLNWVEAGQTSDDHFVIKNGIDTGETYYIAVVSVSKNSMENAIANSPQSNVTIQGKAAAPSDVSGFDVQQRGDQLHFVWDPIADGDLARYVIKRGSDWSVGQVIAEKVDVTDFYSPVGTIGSQTYMIKAIDTSRNESSNAAVDTLTVTPPPEQNFVQQIDPWAQNREYKLVNVSRVPKNIYNKYYTRDVYVLTTTDTWSDLEGAGWDTPIDIDNKGIETSGYIEQVEPIDLGVVFEFKIISDLLYQNAAGGGVTLQMSYSVDGVTYTSFADIDSSQNYRGRYLKFKYILESNGTNQIFFYAGTIYANAANVKVDFGRDQLIDAGGTSITFRDDFEETPRVRAIAIKNGVLGVIKIESISASGMTVKIRDPEAEAYIGTAEIDWEVVGT